MTREALAGYRRLLRARTVAFVGDALALEVRMFTLYAAAHYRNCAPFTPRLYTLRQKSAVALRAAFVENRSESNLEKLAELMRGVDQVSGLPRTIVSRNCASC